jgi:hypothetical protein
MDLSKMSLQKIRRRFIKSADLEDFEKKINDFTDGFNPADILDVQFYCLTEKLRMKAFEVKTKVLEDKENTLTNEEQWHEDRYIAMITYMESEKKENDLLG